MKVKKFTAILFLAFTTLVMQAFAVFPHHHHQEYICFATSHCPQDAEHEQHSHDHDTQKSNPGCVQNLFQTQLSRTLTLEHSCGEGHCHHFIHMPFLAADILEFLSYEAENIPFSSLCYREKLHAACYTSDIAGRAPPTSK